MLNSYLKCKPFEFWHVGRQREKSWHQGGSTKNYDLKDDGFINETEKQIKSPQ